MIFAGVMNFDDAIFFMIDVAVLQIINLELGYCIFYNLTHNCSTLTPSVLETVNDLDFVYIQIMNVMCHPCTEYTKLLFESYDLAESYACPLASGFIPYTTTTTTKRYINSYSENPSVITLFGLSFVFNDVEESFILLEDSGVNVFVLLTLGKNIIEGLNRINSKGYVYPEAVDVSYKFLRELESFLVSHGYERKELGSSNNTYTLWYNLIFLNVYYLMCKELKSYKDSFKSMEGEFNDDSDLYADLETLSSEFKARLDPYLRFQIQKRGVTIIQQIYTGFDTEYELSDYRKFCNKLISTQLAVQTRTLIKLPLYKSFDISYIHPTTSEISNFYKPEIEEWTPPQIFGLADDDTKGKKCDELKLINNSLKYCTQSIRKTLYFSLDELNKKLIEKLRSMGGGTLYFEDNRRDQIVLSLPLTPVFSKINYPKEGYSLMDLLEDSKELCKEQLNVRFHEIVSVLKTLDLKNDTSKLLNWYENCKLKPRSLTKLCFVSDDRVNLSVITNFYICAHYNSADLPMLSDFVEFKDQLSIVNKSFITLGKSLRFYGSSIYFRDTKLLAPGGKGRLDQLGELYKDEGDFSKRVLRTEDKNQMGLLLTRDKKLYEEYALLDAKITLKHATEMEAFNMSIQQIGIPITLSSLGRSFVFDEWRNNLNKFFPYQISGKCLMGNSDEVQTPKGLFSTGDVGLHMSYYIGNYKGGRNESFMYGGEDSVYWFDYDLVNAYTTALKDLSLPDYKQGKLLSIETLKTWSTDQLLQGYLIVNTAFKFPPLVKYPSIPCFVDETSTVYPLEGSSLLTGPEYVLALNQGCEFDIKSIFYIPPTEVLKTNTTDKKWQATATAKEKEIGNTTNDSKTVELIQPFYKIIKEVQGMRVKYPKGSFRNLLYKEIGNSIYGNVVRGMSNKKSFDTLTGKMFRVKGTELSNPILASWTTAFIRSVIGECLHNISKLGGKVVSVTTDGFISDVKCLESKLMQLDRESIPLLLKYRELRKDLAGVGKDSALEIKKEGRGIISWSTRGQLGIESGIKATTGFQTNDLEQVELVNLFKDVMSSSEKYFEFTQKRLRGAKDVFSYGGHVTPVYRDQKFRMFHDNRRHIIEPTDFKGCDLSNVLLDSNPVLNVTQAKKQRFLSKFPFNRAYNKLDSRRVASVYKSFLEIGVRNFIKACVAKEYYFGLKGDEFNCYNDLIAFINDFKSTRARDLTLRLTKQSISNLKHRKLIWRSTPRTPENVAFSEYILTRIPHFKVNEFLYKVS
jgi:hypothetical protein